MRYAVLAPLAVGVLIAAVPLTVTLPTASRARLSSPGDGQVFILGADLRSIRQLGAI